MKTGNGEQIMSTGNGKMKKWEQNRENNGEQSH